MSGHFRGTPLSLAPSGGDAPSNPIGLPVRGRDLRTFIRPTVAEIDLDSLRRNAARVRALLDPGTALYGVVKADAYGHGAATVARVLEPLCEMLAVSLAEEGLELRASGITAPILVLGAYYGQRQSDVLEQSLTPVIYDQGDLERFAQAPVRRRAAKARGLVPTPPGSDTIDVHLKIDTGMNRLGVAVDQLDAFLDRAAQLARVRIVGACTHLACADEPDPSVTHEQLQRFEQARAVLARHGVHPAVVHAANSAGTVRFPEARLQAVRPGLALYGALPSRSVALPGLEPVLRWTTRIMALHDLAVGATVSYGARFTAARPTRVATLPVGYADGYPRHVRDAQVLVRGRRVPVAGAVCMDMTMVDVTDVPGVSMGDEVTLIGADGDQTIGVDELAERAGTVNYEILCGLSKRVPRLYRDGGRVGSATELTGEGS